MLLVASISVSYLISNGSYYWISDTWRTSGQIPSFGGWIENLGDWYLPYLRTTAIYLGIAALLHAGTMLAARGLDDAARAGGARSVRG